MIAKKIKILIKSDGSYLDTILPPITANEDGRTIVQVIAPFPITDIVSVNYSIRPIQATVKGSYLLPTGKFGKDVLDEDYTHFQTVADWNVFEIPINAVALEYISKYRAGLVLVSFTIKQLQTPYFATNYLGLFSDTNPIPTTTYNDGDYFIANEYNFTAHDITWAKGDYAYFYNGKWNKGKSVLKASTPSIELPVDPSLKDAPQLEYDEDVALLLANDLGLLTQRVSQSETDIESAENDINEIDGRVGVNENDIYNLENDVDDLETEIGNIKNGTTIVKKAEQDQLGNVINTTYETKAVVSGISTLISSLDLSKLNKEFTSLIEEVSLSLSDVFVVDKGSGARKVSLGTIASYLSTQELQLFTIVGELPIENQNPNTIYLLATENEEGQNQLLEYIWIANQERWELIGSLEVDLSDYYTKAEVNGLLEDKVDKNNAITAGTKAKITYDAKGLVTGGADLVESDIPPLAISKVTNLQSSLDNKVDKVSGKALSQNDFTDDEKTKLSGIEPNAEVNNISDADASELTGGEETDLHKHAAADVNITDTGEYYDSTDVEGVLQEVGSELASLANRAQLKPEFAETVEDCTDTTKLYVLPDGYIYAYLKTIIPGGPAYINLATAFQEGYRLNSSGTTAAQAGATTCTDYIPFTPGTVVRIKGFGALLDYNIAVYATNQVVSSSGKANVQGDYASYAYDSASGIVTLTSGHSSVKYLRVSGILSGTTADVIITANEEIENGEPVESYEWKNTGLAFVPADYEDRIIELEEDVLVLKNDVEALSSDSSEDAMIPSYWEPMVADKTATIKALQEAGGKDCVCFAWASDTHIPDNDTGRTTDIGKVMAKMLDNCEIPFAVLTGDIGTRASYPTEAGLIAAQASMPIHLAPLWGTDRLLMALGNHDGCWGDSSGYYRHQFTPDRMWQIYFRGQALDFRRVFSEDGSYYYVDNTAQKTRFIVLNSQFGGEYAVNENGYAVNNRFATSCYGQEQLDWLADIALDMPEGYNAIITSHVPPNITYTVDKAQFIGIVNAYCNKTTYSGSYTAGVDGWTNNNISVDFTNAKGEIIAMFTGHVHGDSIDTTTMVCPILTILSAGATANEHNGFSEPDSGRTAGTDTETNFDVVTINKATRTIYCTRVGAGSDRQVSY